jgi:hypothetical protein
MLGGRQIRRKRQRGEAERNADEKTDLSHFVPP